MFGNGATTKDGAENGCPLDRRDALTDIASVLD
jgi:hypothetical protein